MIYVENELIGRRLRHIRTRSGLEYPDMAKILGVSEGHYRKIERGVYGLDVRKLLLLHRKLRVNPMYLLTGNMENELKYIQEENVSDRNAMVCELLDYCKKQLTDAADESDLTVESAMMRNTKQMEE